MTIHEEPIELTFKEFELLKYLAKNEGRAVSREELINQIWGYDFIGESRTLDVHINSLRKKMGNEYAHWIQSVRQVGYRFVAEDHNAQEDCSFVFNNFFDHIYLGLWFTLREFI